MLKSILSNYSDGYILFKGTITVVGAGATAQTKKKQTEIMIKQY